MTRARLTGMSIALLLVTTPIFEHDVTSRFGLPAWSFAVLVASLVYAMAIAMLLGRHWDLMADEPTEQDRS
jgi:hypothetical protein